jgi:hypothetical protein
MMTAAEGSLMILLFILAVPRLRRLPSLLRRHSYLVMSLAFIVGFVYAFSAVANFGILARQRTQMLPFLLVFLALPAVPIVSPWRKRALRKPRSRTVA